MALDELIDVAQARGAHHTGLPAPPPAQRVTITRNARGRVTAVHDIDAGDLDQITRDARGRVSSFRVNGVVHTITRDARGRATGMGIA